MKKSFLTSFFAFFLFACSFAQNDYPQVHLMVIPATANDSNYTVTALPYMAIKAVFVDSAGVDTFMNKPIVLNVNAWTIMDTGYVSGNKSYQINTSDFTIQLKTALGWTGGAQTGFLSLNNVLKYTTTIFRLRAKARNKYGNLYIYYTSKQ